MRNSHPEATPSITPPSTLDLRIPSGMTLRPTICGQYTVCARGRGYGTGGHPTISTTASSASDDVLDAENSSPVIWILWSHLEISGAPPPYQRLLGLWASSANDSAPMWRQSMIVVPHSGVSLLALGTQTPSHSMPYSVDDSSPGRFFISLPRTVSLGVRSRRPHWTTSVAPFGTRWKGPCA